MWGLVIEWWCPGPRDSLFVASVFVPLGIYTTYLPIHKGNRIKKPTGTESESILQTGPFLELMSTRAEDCILLLVAQLAAD